MWKFSIRLKRGWVFYYLMRSCCNFTIYRSCFNSVGQLVHSSLGEVLRLHQISGERRGVRCSIDRGAHLPRPWWFSTVYESIICVTWVSDVSSLYCGKIFYLRLFGVTGVIDYRELTRLENFEHVLQSEKISLYVDRSSLTIREPTIACLGGLLLVSFLVVILLAPPPWSQGWLMHILKPKTL